MAADAKRSGSITFLLAGVVLLVTAAGLFVAFAPVFRCRNCEIEIAIKKGITHLTSTPEAPILHSCPHCDGKGRVTPLTHWLKCSEHFLQ
jgi:hypothetical protein